ncbi:hypothetical protein R3P38DRAFT_3290625 [Favolaschia claudopus]|uniref:Uncharacterized protein n=1 Tax=Favolaschia claudopus TaxID=2862362 RepID=A0AAV9ZSM5_9AGAR
MDETAPSARSRASSTTSTLKSTPGNSPLLLQVLSPNILALASGEDLLQAGNAAYIGLMMERNIFEGQLAESRDYYQKLLAQITSLRTGEDTSGFATSTLSSTASTLQPRDTGDFPGVKWWTQKDYNKDTMNLSTIDSEDEDDTSAKKYKGYPWVENKDGVPLDKQQSKALAAHLRTALNFVGNKRRAPSHWSDADLEIVKYVRSEMYTAYPDLRLCLHHWKLNAIITLLYPSWKRGWVQNGGYILKGEEENEVNVSGKGKKRKRDAKASESAVIIPRLPIPTKQRPQQRPQHPIILLSSRPAPRPNTSNPSTSSATNVQLAVQPTTPQSPSNATTTVNSSSGNVAPPPSDTTLNDTTNTPRPVKPTTVTKPAPKPAFKSANLFGFGASRPSRISAPISKLDTLAALATSAAPAATGGTAPATQIPDIVQQSGQSQGVGGCTSLDTASLPPSHTIGKEKAPKRTKNPDAVLKANQTNSARNLCIQDYLAARPGQKPTTREFDEYWEGLTAVQKEPFSKRSKAANAEKKAGKAT